jgi:hypothetical protein
MPEYTFQYGPPDEDVPHEVIAEENNKVVGRLSWHPQIENVFVEETHRRKGIATGMYRHAQHISTQFDDVAPPQHNPIRTLEGDAWAKSTGDPLPPRIPPRK